MTMLAHDRNAPVRCSACGRTVQRQARQQVFCGPVCRKRGTGRYIGSKQKNKSLYGLPSAKCGTDPLKNSNEIKAPLDGILGPRCVIAAEITDGREWVVTRSRDGVRSLVARLSRPALVRP